MMKKIRMNCTATLDETFADFLLSRRAKGLAEKTLESYSSQWKAVARHLDTGMDIAALQKADLDDMIVSMRDAGLSPNSINSYTRVLKSFFSWCNEQGLTRLNIPLYKAEETVKETYSDAELTALLKKPDIRKTTFAEYRDWVIINFLLNCGSRAATVRAIQIRDVDLDGGVVFYRHTKNRKAQVIPLCSPMIAILREYGRYRGGEPTDYLFCTETGTQLHFLFHAAAITTAFLPGATPLDFGSTVFSGNGVDIDDPIQYPIDLLNAIFEQNELF